MDNTDNIIITLIVTVVALLVFIVGLMYRIYKVSTRYNKLSTITINKVEIQLNDKLELLEGKYLDTIQAAIRAEQTSREAHSKAAKWNSAAGERERDLSKE